MIQAYEHYFGEYTFKKDGYKLIEVPSFAVATDLYFVDIVNE